MSHKLIGWSQATDNNRPVRQSLVEGLNACSAEDALETASTRNVNRFRSSGRTTAAQSIDAGDCGRLQNFFS